MFTARESAFRSLNGTYTKNVFESVLTEGRYYIRRASQPDKYDIVRDTGRGRTVCVGSIEYVKDLAKSA